MPAEVDRVQCHSRIFTLANGGPDFFDRGHVLGLHILIVSHLVILYTVNFSGHSSKAE